MWDYNYGDTVGISRILIYSTKPIFTWDRAKPLNVALSLPSSRYEYETWSKCIPTDKMKLTLSAAEYISTDIKKPNISASEYSSTDKN
jgi:hypothetical protein